jgi:hypothetical protein
MQRSWKAPIGILAPGTGHAGQRRAQPPREEDQALLRLVRVMARHGAEEAWDDRWLPHWPDFWDHHSHRLELALHLRLGNL